MKNIFFKFQITVYLSYSIFVFTSCFHFISWVKFSVAATFSPVATRCHQNTVIFFSYFNGANPEVVAGHVTVVQRARC